MEKILYFLILILAALGLLGGLGYLLYLRQFAIALGTCALGYLAYPKAKELFEKLSE